ncbi:MAG: capsule assembly Wzi family protein, partial [Bacteroidota bacterium]
ETADRSEAPGLLPVLYWHVDMAAAGGTAERMPLWQLAHRGGRLLDQRSDGWFGARLVTDWRHAPTTSTRSNHFGLSHGFGDAHNQRISSRTYTRWYSWKPDFRAGLDFMAKPEPGESRLHEVFLQLRFGPFQITGGRKSYTSGFAHDPLSTGSLGMSPNHAPFPRVTAGIPHYIPVPFSFNYLEFKGRYSHAWLDDERFTRRPYLHEKALFVRTRSDWPVRLKGGLTHFAMWGGEHPEFGRAPDRFEDYLRMVFGRSADPGHESAEQFPQWVANAIGNHLGIIEFGVGWELWGLEWDAYRQYLFEDGSGMRFYNNKDGLNGLRIRPEQGRSGSWAGGWIGTVLLEYLNTTWQSGPGPPDPPGDPDDFLYDPDEPYFDPDYPYNFGGRDQYYNHYIYRNGWTYRGRAMGTPLMLQQDRGRFYYPDGTFHWRRFVSNRVQAWHLGIEGSLAGFSRSRSDVVSAAGGLLSGYRLMVTRARHQGTYDNVDIFNRFIDPGAPFAEEPVQYHTLLELSGRVPWFDGQFSDDPASLLNELRLTLALSMDAGDLANHFGLLIGIRWGNAPF